MNAIRQAKSEILVQAYSFTSAHSAKVRPSPVRHGHALTLLLGIRGFQDPAAGRILVQNSLESLGIYRGSFPFLDRLISSKLK